VADRKRLLQPHQGAQFLQKVQEVEVYEDVEEDHQTPKQDEGAKFTRGEIVRAPGSF
jgi:hypothetical protein